MESALEKATDIAPAIRKVLLGICERRREVIELNLVAFRQTANKCLMGVIGYKIISRPKDAKLMPARFDLGGKRKVSCRSTTLGNDNPQFVHDIRFARGFQRWALKAMGDDHGIISAEELSDFANAVADDIMQELPRKSRGPNGPSSPSNVRAYPSLMS